MSLSPRTASISATTATLFMGLLKKHCEDGDQRAHRFVHLIITSPLQWKPVGGRLHKTKISSPFCVPFETSIHILSQLPCHYSVPPNL